MLKLKIPDFLSVHVLVCALEIATAVNAGTALRVINKHSETANKLAKFNRVDAYWTLKIALRGPEIKKASCALQIASEVDTRPVSEAAYDLITELAKQEIQDMKVARRLRLCCEWAKEKWPYLQPTLAQTVNMLGEQN